MRKDSQFDQNEIYIITAALAAHANFLKDGFRQKDIKFMIEMFSNWMDFTLPESTLNIHNTQVMRYLNELVKEGWAKVSRGEKPRYKLTAIGLLSLVSRLVNRPPSFPLEDFYFVYHFLETYRPPIEELLRGESKALPSAIRVELDFLLDMKKYSENQVRFLEHEIRKLRQRILDSDTVTKIVRKGRADKKITKDVVTEIEKRFPYDLNSQKPLSEFYQEIPDQIRDFILDVAISKRTKQIWNPMLKVLESHLEAVKTLQNSESTKPKARPTET